jgi:two-component system sensor histidine kinase UhpB
MALGHVPLRDILAEMVHERARQHPQVSFAFSAQKIDQSYGDSIDLTLYRCVQESLTNVIRHAQAKQVTVDLAELRDGEAGAADGAEAMIRLTVRDDGLGIGPGTRRGFGISGMQERVEALGGDYEVESRSGAGTCVRVAIPLRGGQNCSGRPQEEGVAQ